MKLKWILYIIVLILGIKQLGFAQDIIIQPPVFGPFECTDFYKLYTGSVSNFTGKEIRGQMLVQVDYTNPSGRTFRLAEGRLSGNPAVIFNSSLTIIDNATLDRVYPARKITFFDKSMEDLIRRTKCLPPGEYNVCLSLYEEGGIDGTKPYLTQTCYVREVANLSPLLLVSPFDEDEIVTMLPLFSWTAVTPMIPEARYQIQMVELLANQTSFHALRANPLFFSQGGMVSNIMQYPISARALNPCSVYAWKVIYTLDEGVGGNDFLRRPNYLQESEIWTFRTPCQEDENEKNKGNNVSLINPEYFKTTLENSGIYTSIKGDLIRFTCSFPYKEKDNLSFAIYNERMELVSSNVIVYNEVTTNDIPNLTENEFYGDNKFVAELPANIYYDQPFILMISNTKTKQYLRFIKRQ